MLRFTRALLAVISILGLLTSTLSLIAAFGIVQIGADLSFEEAALSQQLMLNAGLGGIVCVGPLIWLYSSRNRFRN